MPEPEELLIEAARHATVAVRDVWRRRRGPAETAPETLLVDVRGRLEMLVEAVLGRAWPIRTAQLPAPMPLARRLWSRLPTAAAATEILPGNDGAAIYLPPALPLANKADTGTSAQPDAYSLYALLQALRCERGSAAFAQLGTPIERDLFLVAETAAADVRLRALLPGWKRALDALCADAVGKLRQRRASGAAQAVANLYACVLEGAAPERALPSARAAFAWAQAEARRLTTGTATQRYDAWLADAVCGRFLCPDAPATARAGSGAAAARPGDEADARQRTAELARRPRVRESQDDEDDAEPGLWMIQTSEPQKHVEDPLGLNRPEDHAPDEDAQGAAESLAELDQARLVRTPGRVREVLLSDSAPPAGEAPDAGVAQLGGIAYPEWDYRRDAYRENAAGVHVARAAEGAQAWVDETLLRHGGLMRDIGRRLGALRPDRERLTRQMDGDEIDADALTRERSERHAGVAPAGAVYQLMRPAPRRLGLLLLIDASASTDAWVADQARVIDVEKEAALVAAAALAATSVEFALYAFSGESAAQVQLRAIKRFDERWDAAGQRRIAGIEPDRYTRLGAALRHATALLAARRVDHRLLLLLSDGRPNDCDVYAGRYGLDDARQALFEARLQHVSPYCLTVDQAGSAYLPSLFGAGHYTVVSRPQQLPFAFVDWLRQAARRCR